MEEKVLPTFYINQNDAWIIPDNNQWKNSSKFEYKWSRRIKKRMKAGYYYEKSIDNFYKWVIFVNNHFLLLVLETSIQKSLNQAQKISLWSRTRFISFFKIINLLHNNKWQIFKIMWILFLFYNYKSFTNLSKRYIIKRGMQSSS